MDKRNPISNEELQLPIARPQVRAPSRELVSSDLIHETQQFVLSDGVFDHLKLLNKAIPILYDYLRRERRRKTRSEEFQWLLAEFCKPPGPTSCDSLVTFGEMLHLIRKQMEGEALPQDAGRQALHRLQSLMKIRKDPRYWREYKAYLGGRTVSDIIREFHPTYAKLEKWEREKYFRKVYNAIGRLVAKYGGRPLQEIAPNSGS